MSEAYSDDGFEAWHGQGASFEAEIFGESYEQRLAAADFGVLASRIIEAIPETHEYSLLGVPGRSHMTAVRLLSCGFNTVARPLILEEDSVLTSSFMNVCFQRQIGTQDKRTIIIVNECVVWPDYGETETDVVAVFTAGKDAVRHAKRHNGDSEERLLGSTETRAVREFITALYLDKA